VGRGGRRAIGSRGEIDVGRLRRAAGVREDCWGEAGVGGGARGGGWLGVGDAGRRGRVGAVEVW
jgi:hypothetical protein